MIEFLEQRGDAVSLLRRQLNGRYNGPGSRERPPSLGQRDLVPERRPWTAEIFAGERRAARRAARQAGRACGGAHGAGTPLRLTRRPTANSFRIRHDARRRRQPLDSGPTNVPDQVLNAMHRPALDIYSGECWR